MTVENWGNDGSALSVTSVSDAVTALIILTAMALLILLIRIGWWWRKEWADQFAIAESLLAIAGLVGGGAWYFIAQPDAPKLKIEQSAIGFPIENGRLVILSELTLSNLGTRPLQLKSVPIKLYVQQITPATEPLTSEFPIATQNHQTKIMPADSWMAIAKYDSHIDSNMGGGEFENYYHRVVVNCAPELRVYVTAWIYKPRSIPDRLMNKEQLAWIKQTPLDLSDKCPLPAKGVRGTKK